MPRRSCRDRSAASRVTVRGYPRRGRIRIRSARPFRKEASRSLAEPSLRRSTASRSRRKARTGRLSAIRIRNWRGRAWTSRNCGKGKVRGCVGASVRGCAPQTGAPTNQQDLREDADDDAAILRAAVLGVVRRDRLLFAVADHVDLVQRNLVLHIQVTLHRFGALETELVVAFLRPDVVGVALYLNVQVLSLRVLELGDHRVEAHLGFGRQFCLAELEIALIFAQGDFIDQLPQRGDVGGNAGGNLIDARADLTRGGVGGIGGVLRGSRRLSGCFSLLVDVANLGLILLNATLRLLDGPAQRVELRVDAADFRSNVLFGSARRGDGHRHCQQRCCDKTLTHCDSPPQMYPTYSLLRGGHIPAARVNDKVLLSCADFERVPTGTQTRLEGDQVLVPQLPKEIVDSCGDVLRHAAHAHVAAGPPGEVGERADV